MTQNARTYGLPTTAIPLSSPDPTLARTSQITGHLLFLVGEDDAIGPPEHRQQVAGALRAAGVRHELVEYPGVRHGFLSAR